MRSPGRVHCSVFYSHHLGGTYENSLSDGILEEHNLAMVMSAQGWLQIFELLYYQWNCITCFRHILGVLGLTQPLNVGLLHLCREAGLASPIWKALENGAADGLYIGALSGGVLPGS